ALKRLDKNNDGRLTADEIEARLSFFQSQGMLGGVVAEVTLDGDPVEGATVTLEPEKFLGPAFKPASGITDAGGGAILRVEGATHELIPHGYYRVRVSKKNSRGQETIPARYNVNTVLGHEAGPESEGRGGGGGTLSLPLRSR